MKVLVTGGTGFIGHWVIRELLERGHGVLVFDRQNRARGYPVFLGDIRDAGSVAEAMAQADSFIHLAAILGTQETIQNPKPAAFTNLMGGLNILESSASLEKPGCYIGVGNHWMDNTYSISKTMVERFINMYNKERGTYINIVRAMNAYGPGQVAAPPYGTSPVRKITPSFVCRALAGDDIEIYGDGEQISDMVYVKDVAYSLVSAMEYAVEKQVFAPIECGPKESCTVKHVAELIIELIGSTSKIVHLPMRPGELPGATVSADTRTLLDINIDPDDFTTLKDGMQETINYFASLGQAEAVTKDETVH